MIETEQKAVHSAGASYSMSPDELVAFGKARYGEHWCGPLADETGWSFSHLWRIANGERRVSRKLEKSLRNLGPRKDKK
jgi:hypothetical protein